MLPFVSDILHDNVDQLADRLALEPGWWPNGCRQSKDGAFMMLLGAAGTGTGFHSDLTEALSVGFEVSNGASDSTPIAYWCLVNPAFIAAVNQSVKDLFPTVYGEGLATISWKTVKGGKVREHGRALTLAEMRLLEEKMPEGVTIIAQHPGDLIYIPPGWVHAVINMRHCIKFAVDLFVPTHLHMYALSMALVGSPYTSWHIVKMCVMSGAIGGMWPLEF